MKIKKGIKGRFATLVALIVTLICAGIAAFVGAFGGFGSGVQTASANAAANAYNIGNTTGTFDANGLKKLMGQIMGKSTASYNELKSFIDKQPDKQYESSKFNNNAGYFTVNLGGIAWNVVFASEDTSGEVVATLWQASSSLHAQWNPWYSTDKTLYYPSNMYGTSFIRASLVNSQYAASAMDENTTGMSGSGGWDGNRRFMDYINSTNAVQKINKIQINRTTGLPYQKDGKEVTMEVSVPVNQVYQTYHPIVTAYGKYLDTPSQIPWQWYQSNREIYGTAWYGDPKNDGLFGNKSGSLSNNPGGWWSPDDDYTGKNGYSNWGGDKIWLPSGYETGYDNSEWASGGCIYPNPTQRSGFWGLPSAARKNATTAVTQDEIDKATKGVVSNYVDSTGTVAGNGQTNMDNSSWLRSGDDNSADYADSVVSGGSNYYYFVSDLRAVRPALHLNLKSAAAAAGLFVEKPATTELTKAFSATAGTVTVPSVTNMAVTYPTSWAKASDTTVTVPASTPVGTYNITYAPAAGYSWSDGSVGAVTVPVRITPATISTITWGPAGASFAYTGSQIAIGASAAGAGSLPVIVTGDNVNVGTFTVTAVNTNPNYVFSSTLTTSKTITITKQEITAVDWSIANNASFEYDAQNHAPTASFKAANGQVYSLPVTLQKDGSAASSAVDAGSYVATVAAGTYANNFELKTASALNFTVAPREIQIDWGAETYAYSGGNLDTAVSLKVASGLLGSDSVTLNATYVSGDKKNVTDGGFVMEAAISGTSSNYKLPAVKTHTYKITPLVLSGVTATASGSYTYNGSIQTPAVSLTGGNIVTGDTVNAVVSGGGIDAGTQSATVIGVDNPNYSLGGALSVSFTVKPLDISDIKWSITDAQEFTYDGKNHAPSAWFVYNGVTYALTSDLAEAYNASATAYTANVKAGVFQNNFNLVDLNATTPTGNAASVTFKINKAEITANDVEWSFLSGAKFAPGAKPAVQALFRFNNQAYVLDVDFTTSNGNVSTWTAGDYKATAKLGADVKFANFSLSGAVSRDLKIADSAAGTYTVIWEGFSSIITYNGQNQKPTAYVIVDGEKISVNVGIKQSDGSVSLTEQAKNAGTYTYVASLAGYTLDNEEVTQRIDPRTISVVYSNLTGLQHGALDGGNNPVTVTASTLDPVALLEFNANELNFVVTGGSNLAGTRVVTAEVQSKDGGNNWVACGNYVISNASAVQTVSKKVLTDNDIIWSPNGLTFTYDGNVKIPAGTVKTTALAGGDSGSVYVIFEFVYAVEVGTYQVKVLGISNDNYTFEGTKTVTITADGSQTVQWEGVQNGGSVVYNGANQLPKPYIVIDGEKVYLDVSSLTRDGANATEAIRAGSYVATVDAETAGNVTYAQSTVTFTITPYEIKTIYLTQNVFIYSGNNNAIEVYALGVNQEKVVISNKTVTKDGTAVTTFTDAGSYAVSVSTGVLSSNSNYTVASTVNTVTFVINPMSVTVDFGSLSNWVFTDGNNPQIVITASVANAVKVQYGKFGTVNQEVADNGSGTFTIAANSMASLIGQRGMISVTAKNGNYQISGQDFQTFEVVSSASAATAEFKLDGVAWADDNKTFTYGDSAAIAVAGSDGVEIKYYKDGVLLSSPITSVENLDAGTYLITATHSSLAVSSNVNGASRSFTVNPKEVDLSSASWVIDGSAVAGNKVAYNGQIYNATLDLGANADDFAVYYTNGASKNVGSVTTKATVVPKSGNYKAINVTESYSWEIESVSAKVAWNDDGTVANVTGDSETATGGSFFEKDGASYKVVYKKGGVALSGAPTEAGDYTAEVVLALGNDGNVEVSAQSFDFTIGITPAPAPSGETVQSWWWILIVAVAGLALFVAIIALIVAGKKKNAVTDADGFYDDATEDDLKG